jgi:mono/diheme cytochrome c family protein
MNRNNNISILILFVLVALGLSACSGPHGNDPGNEYMPDMGHSIAYEANVHSYYYLNTWDSASVKTLKELSMPKKPVNGTIPRGYAGAVNSNGSNGVAVPVNGNVPYYYGNTDQERARASAEIIDNPFPITKEGLAKGKELYNLFCAICHGEKGDGNGWLVDEANPNAAYPAAPANFLLDTFYNSTNGRYYHAIMQGKGVMGAYNDKISYKERWEVIHWIHALQAKESKKEYSEEANTLTASSVDVPGATIKHMAQNMGENEEMGQSEDTHEGDHDAADHSHSEEDH